ncbi:DUF4258 domain-containing protein [Rhodoferax sp.]|uniref:DUF4258 domain-containing protein n=1 Tax=Rhodoferax sp. TaxID=50421 RepID=UPI0039B8799F
MADFLSQRFGKNVWITHHARKSMQKREIDDATLERLIEEGEVKRRSDVAMWVFKHIAGPTDNLICVAAVEKAAVIVKTVMINWELEDEV